MLLTLFLFSDEYYHAVRQGYRSHAGDRAGCPCYDPPQQLHVEQSRYKPQPLTVVSFFLGPSLLLGVALFSSLASSPQLISSLVELAVWLLEDQQAPPVEQQG